jgi:RHS repeat-associated protein
MLKNHSGHFHREKTDFSTAILWTFFFTLDTGEVRYSSSSLPTRYQYTGQYTYAADFGLYFYNARWFDGSLGRFTSADTLIPNPGDPQAWDRYAAMNTTRSSSPIRADIWRTEVAALLLWGMIGGGIDKKYLRKLSARKTHPIYRLRLLLGM